MSFQNQWGAFAARLGTSPKQLAILLASVVIAIGIFGGKVLLAPKSAAAATAEPAVTTKSVETTTAPAIPDIFLQAIPHWNLAATPARNPFTSPEDLKPAIDTTSPATGNAPTSPTALVLQATLDRAFAVVNGKTLRVGQSWTDTKTGQAFRLIEVGERSATFSVGSQVVELSLAD